MTHSVTRLNPAWPTRPPTPQCSVPVTVVGASESYLVGRARKATTKGWSPDLCQCQSAWIIDGKPYCTKHGGMIALQILSLPPEK